MEIIIWIAITIVLLLAIGWLGLKISTPVFWSISLPTSAPSIYLAAGGFALPC